MADNSQWARQMRVGLLPIIVIVIGGQLFFAYLELQASRARDSIVKFLDAPDAEFDVTVNSNSWGANQEMLDAIRHIHCEAGHHSGPEHEIFVEIRGKRGQLELVLARDSGNRTEYWVFWGKEAGKESRREIGRINTSILDRE